MAERSRAPALEVRGLNVYYGASHALQGVDLRLDRGVLSVVGRAVPRLKASRVTAAADRLRRSAEEEDDDDMSEDAALESHLQRVRAAATTLLSSADLCGAYKVRSDKFHRQDGTPESTGSTTHTVLVKRDSVSCDCWHFRGKRILCSHIFHVICEALHDVASVEEGSDTLIDLMAAIVSEFIGSTQWFVCRAPVVV
jgi:hypothetical protein